MTRCVLHNPEVNIEAAYMMLLPIGNDIPVCIDCCAWWRASLMPGGFSEHDEQARPVSIRSIRSAA